MRIGVSELLLYSLTIEIELEGEGTQEGGFQIEHLCSECTVAPNIELRASAQPTSRGPREYSRHELPPPFA